MTKPGTADEVSFSHGVDYFDMEIQMLRIHHVIWLGTPEMILSVHKAMRLYHL